MPTMKIPGGSRAHVGRRRLAVSLRWGRRDVPSQESRLQGAGNILRDGPFRESPQLRRALQSKS